MSVLPYKLLLFDADETLFDFKKALCVSLSKALESFGLECDNKTIETYDEINEKYWRLYEHGKITREQLRIDRCEEFFKTIGVDCDPKKFDDRYLENLGRCPYLLNGADKLCAELSKRYKMAIVTNGIAEMQKKRIKYSPIKEYFEHVFISEEAGFQKPDKRFFDYALCFYPDFKREEILIIGDSLTADIKGGNNAGIATCWLNRSGKKAYGYYKIDYEARSYEELKKLLLC